MNCLATPGPRFARLLTPIQFRSFTESGPRRNNTCMRCDWSNRIADSRQASCSSRQFENSAGIGIVSVWVRGVVPRLL